MKSLKTSNSTIILLANKLTFYRRTLKEMWMLLLFSLRQQVLHWRASLLSILPLSIWLPVNYVPLMYILMKILTSIRKHKLPTPVSLFNIWLVLCWHNIVNTLSLCYNSLLFKMTSVPNNSLYLILVILQQNYWGALMISQGITGVHWNTVWKLFPTAIVARIITSVHNTCLFISHISLANRLKTLFKNHLHLYRNANMEVIIIAFTYN